jgi:hypothetical protein
VASVSRRKERKDRERAEAHSKVKSDFLMHMSHEIRTVRQTNEHRGQRLHATAASRRLCSLLTRSSCCFSSYASLCVCVCVCVCVCCASFVCAAHPRYSWLFEFASDDCPVR